MGFLVKPPNDFQMHNIISFKYQNFLSANLHCINSNLGIFFSIFFAMAVWGFVASSWFIIKYFALEASCPYILPNIHPITHLSLMCSAIICQIVITLCLPNLPSVLCILFPYLKLLLLVSTCFQCVSFGPFCLPWPCLVSMLIAFVCMTSAAVFFFKCPCPGSWILIIS